ncbi:MAG TPA: Lrp/AsnC family transcriptional regulator [Longimicrobiales bacterium]|nr:Lrp/AsnC family transcriptional regulator [Longimicrobiales bacterium]
MIDEVDRTILDALQQNARTSNAEIARRVGMAPSAIFQRVRKLEESGLIQGYTARLNAKALGYGLVAFIMVQTRDNASSVDTAGLIAELPEVLEVHRVVGEDCFIVKARVRDTDHLAELLEHRLQPIRSIASTRTTIVVKTVKDRDDLPMASANGSG